MYGAFVMLIIDEMNIIEKNNMNVNPHVSDSPFTKNTDIRNPIMLVSINPALKCAYFISYSPQIDYI